MDDAAAARGQQVRVEMRVNMHPAQVARDAIAMRGRRGNQNAMLMKRAYRSHDEVRAMLLREEKGRQLPASKKNVYI